VPGHFEHTNSVTAQTRRWGSVTGAEGHFLPKCYPCICAIAFHGSLYKGLDRPGTPRRVVALHGFYPASDIGFVR